MKPYESVILNVVKNLEYIKWMLPRSFATLWMTNEKNYFFSSTMRVGACPALRISVCFTTFSAKARKA